MKKIEKIIKNSIQINDLEFFDKLPKIENKKNYKPVFSLALIVFLFTIIICNIHLPKNLSNEMNDNIIFNMLNIDSKFNTNMDQNINAELIYSYELKEANLDNINKYYSIDMTKNNLISSNYVTYSDDQNTILGAEFIYNYNNKNIKVNISNNLETWNIQTNGLINILNNSAKSIINNKQIILAKLENNEYPKYIMYEYENDKNYYYSLYIKDNLYYYITCNNVDKEDFIEFLKEVIL